MSRFQVDVAAVAAMGRAFAQVRGGIEADMARVRADGAALGTPRLAERLADVVDNWSQQRAEVLAHLEAMGAAAAATAEGYRQVDAAVAHAAGAA